MNDLTKLMLGIAEAEKQASINLDAVAPKNLPAMQMAKADALDRIEKLKADYKVFMTGATFTIFTSGTPEDQRTFALIAQQEADVLVVSANDLYMQLAKAVEPTLGDRRTFGTSQLAFLIRSMGDMCRDFKLRDLRTPEIFDLAHPQTLDELATHIRNIIRISSGDALNKAFLENKIFNQAMEVRYNKSVVPVVVLDAVPGEADALGSTLFSQITFKVATTAEMCNKEAVLQKLTEIRQELKSRKTN